MNSEDFYLTNNARHLNPSEVAKSFIWSDNFGKLIQNKHTVILGARGCGKTTLMKMLTLPALHNWRDSRASKIRKEISFFGVYISTDIYWDVKNQTYGAQLEKFGSFSQAISLFSVNSNVFLAICDTFKNIIEFELQLFDEEKETELCQKLISAWKLPKTIPTLNYVKEALNERVDEVNQLIQNLIFNYKDGDPLPYNDYFSLTFESSLESIIPTFERIYSITGKKNWALCFDELEFAPLWLQETLFKSLRSRKQYILYKLSASPILSTKLESLLKNEYRATSGNDLEMVKMWSSKDNESFSKKIIESLLFKKHDSKDISKYFGTNDIYNKNTDSYTLGSKFHNEIIELSKKDHSFADFLQKRGVDPQNPTFISRVMKDVLFRKIKPIVYFRNYFIDENKPKGKPILRKRKTADIFSGIEVLFKICDGNPRWLIGIVSEILSKSGTQKAEASLQASEIESAALRFKNVIGNIPIGINKRTTIIDIIDKIGEHFNNQVLGKDFHLDPKGTIEVDTSSSDVSDDVVDLIKKGISQGAFILLDSENDSFDFDIRNKKIKLSYLFFILYKLPVRKYNSVKLSECLKNLEYFNPNQSSLFE